MAVNTFTLTKEYTDSVILYPNADGSSSDWSLYPNTGESNWEDVDDTALVPDGDDTYVYMSGPVALPPINDTDFYTLDTSPLPSSASIVSVVINNRAKYALSSTIPSDVFSRIAITDDGGANIYYTSLSLTNTYSNYTVAYDTNPRTGNAWTVADLDNLEIGQKGNVYSTYSSPGIQELYLPVNGDDTTGIANGCGETTHYECVVDSPPDDSSYVWSDDVNQWKTDLYDVTNHTTESGTITEVIVFFRTKELAGVGRSRGKAAIKIGGTSYYGDVKTASSNWNTYSYSWSTNPNTGVAWTWANIDNLLAGVSLQAYGVLDAEVACSQVYVVVKYQSDAFELRTTQTYAKVIYSDTETVDLPWPEEIVCNHSRITKMINFWDGEREVYDLKRSSKSILLRGKIYKNDPAKVLTIRPNADVAFGIGPSTHGAANGYECVDEVVPDEDVTYVYANDGEFTSIFNYETIPTNTGKIYGLKLHWRAKAMETEGETVFPGVIIDGTYYSYIAEYSNNLTGQLEYTNFEKLWLTNPDTGEDWTVSDINNLSAGVQTFAPGVREIRVTQVYAEVELDTICYLQSMLKTRDTINVSGLNLRTINGDYKVRGFYWKVLSQKPVAYEWMIELEDAEL